MKTLLRLLLLPLLFVACTKSANTASTPQYNTSTYTGSYVLTNNTFQGEFDSLALSYNTSTTYFISHLNANAGNNVLCNVNGSACTIPSNSNYPSPSFVTVGTGLFSGNQLTLDYTTDAVPYNASLHRQYHSIYNKK